jgi:ribosomal-protein-alanine N-acetyltransferase
MNVESISLTIDKMNLQDLSQVTEIEKQLFNPPWSYETFLSEVESESRCCLVVRCADGIIGYAICAILYDEAHILSIGVAKKYQKLSIATLLMVEIMDYAISNAVVKVILEVRVSNDKAKGLYEKFGFAPVGIRKKYYTQPSEDAIVYLLDSLHEAQYLIRLDKIRQSLESK